METASLMPHKPGQAFIIRVQGALFDELREDLRDQGFPVIASEDGSLQSDESVRLVEVSPEADEMALYGFLGFWNEQHYKE